MTINNRKYNGLEKEKVKHLRIAVVCDSFPKLSETFIMQHIIGLIDEGHEVEIFALNSSSEEIVHPSVKEYRLFDITQYPTRMPTNRFCKYMRGLELFVSRLKITPTLTFKSLNFCKHGWLAVNLRLLYLTTVFKGQHYDIVHAHFGPVGVLVTKLLDMGAIHGRLIVSFHGYDLNQKSLVSIKDYYTDLFKKAEKILVNSPFSRKRLLALGAPENNVQVLPIPVDVSVFHPRRRAEKFGIVRLLSVSRLSEEKGLIYALDAMRMYLRQYDSNIQYDIIGGGPLLERLQSYIRKNGLGDNVRLLSVQPQNAVIDRLDEADILIFPSIELSTGEVDTQGVVIQEAQAMGLPVIASDVGGVRDGIIDGITGYLVAQKNVENLVVRIRQLSVNLELRCEMGNAGRENVIKNFSSLVVRRLLNDIYCNLTVI